MRTLTQPLNMSPGGIPPVIHVSQYDSDFTIVFTLFSTVGDFTIESGTTAMVRGTKSSGTGYSADAAINISAKTVTVTGNQQMTAAAGQNVFEITLYKNNKEISSKNFILLCERAALDMDTIEDKTIARELDNLDQFVAEAEAAADRAENASVSLRAIKTALLNCFQHVAWTDEHGQDYYDALEVAFNGKELASITAVFTQGSATIYPDTPLDDLKQYLVVTANYTDSTSAPVTDYTLRGTLAEGTSIITAIYGGKTATFDVVVTALPWDFEWNASTKQAPSNMEAQSFDFTTYPGFMYANNMNFYIENSVGDGEIEFHGFVPLHAYLETTPRIYLKSGDDGNMGVGFGWLFNCADGDGKTVCAWTENNKNYLDIDQTVEADFRLKVENGIGYWFYNNELVFSSNDPTYDTQLLGTGFYTVVDNTYICVSSIKYRKL